MQILVFFKKLDKVKKASGQILACHEIFEKDPSKKKHLELFVLINLNLDITICIKKLEVLH